MERKILKTSRLVTCLKGASVVPSQDADAQQGESFLFSSTHPMSTEATHGTGPGDAE